MKAENKRGHEPVEIPIFDLETMARDWWVLLLRGLAGIIFGVLTFIWPATSLAALVLLFGAYAFADLNLPVGVVTGAFGAPFLLWLLARGPHGAHRTGRRAA